MRWKKFLAVMLAAAMTCNMTGVSAAAQPAVMGSFIHKLFGGDDADKDEDAQTDTQKKTRSQMYGTEAASKADSVTLDIGRGDILISGKEISGYDTEGNLVTKSSPRYVVTGSTQEHSIKIADGANANIVLSNVNITRTGDGQSPFEITDDSDGDVSITLEGINNLQAGKGAAAIQKSGTSDKGLSKSGQLKITCGNTSPGHVCDASCGTLVATGGEGAAAIGGAAGRGSSKIDIAGGTITAAGGIGGGSGGVGTKMEFTGGVIDAGTINGKTDGKDNVMNGNVLLFADNTADMKLKKGTVYQRGTGTGTVYGDTEWSQAMVDHLVATGGTMDIPAGEKAAVTVDGATDISALAFTEGSQVKVDTSKTPAATEQAAAETTAPTPEETAPTPEETAPTPEETTQTPEATEEPTATPEPTEEATATPEPTEEVTETPEPTKAPAKARARRAVPTEEPVVEEEGQEQERAGDAISGGSTSGGNSDQNYYRTAVTADVTDDDGNRYPANSHLRYGQSLKVFAHVEFSGGTEIPGLTGPPASTNNTVVCYLTRVDASGNSVGAPIPVGERPLGVDTITSGVKVDLEVPVIIRGDEITPGNKYNFTARYEGTNLFPAGGSTPLNYTIDIGTLSVSRNTIDVPATAGHTIAESIDLRNLAPPTIEAGVPVTGGSWNWVSANWVSINEAEIERINATRLYPSVTDASNVYYAVYTQDKAEKEDGKYERKARLTIRFDVTALSVDRQAEVKSKPVDHPVPGHDGKSWYNATHTSINIKVDGYQILKPDAQVLSSGDWEDKNNWADAEQGLSFNDLFHTGSYSMYVKRTRDGAIGSVVLEDFNVDKIYPVIDSMDQTVTGETATFQFGSTSENDKDQGSGIYQYWMESKARLRGTDFADPPLSERDVLNTREDFHNSTGYFYIPGLTAQTWYDMGLIVEDNACNRSKYISRVLSGNINPTKDEVKAAQGTPISSNKLDEYYGYAFQTDKRDMKGTVTLQARDQDGLIKSQINVGDTITATVVPEGLDYGDLQYSWWRSPSSGAPVRITEAGGSQTYTVKEADIGSKIVCRVRGTETSELGTIQDEIGPVVPAMWPKEYWPVLVSENREDRTFTFKGNATIQYEYSINDGDWTDVPIDGRDEHTIELGDVTVLQGRLKVRAKEVENRYTHSDPPLTNNENYIGSGELAVKIEGENFYGGTLTAVTGSGSIDPGLFTYQWSCEGQDRGSDSGYTYQVRKEDIDKRISVKIAIAGYPGADNTATSETIGRRPVTPTVNVTPKQYDGTTTAEATIELDGVLPGDDVTVSVTSAAFADKNAGEDKNVRISTQLGGTDRNYYSIGRIGSEAKGTIQPRVLDLEMTAQDKVYDGTTDAVVTFEASPLAGDSVEVSGTGQFADKNVGTNKRVTPKDVQVTGRDARNYTGTGSTASTTASITPKTIEIEGITVADKEYDGTTDAVITATFKGALDAVDYTYTAAFENPNVGSDKRVTAEITLTGDSASNYNLSSGTATGRGNIVKAPAPYEESDIPQGLTGIEGKKLSSVFIGRGFNWKDPSTVMKTVGRHTYPAIYNPDPSQYGDRELKLEVLVQCADHTWGDWSITVEPTKEEVGERQRICGVCGYTETETIPRAPYIATEDTKVGWNDIIQAINNASSGTEIPVEMNGTETLPASVLDALQGREVSIVLQMGDGITWTIRGEDITASTLKDINMALTMYTDNIPSDVLDSYAAEKTVVQLHLAYSGDFGFVATLRIPLGDEYAGIDSTLYYYNPTRERMEKMDSNKITSDGIGRYDFTHASDYAVVIDKKPDSDVNGGDTPSGNNNTSGTVTPIAPSGTTTGGSTNTSGSTTGGASAGRVAATGTASSNTSSNTVGISSNGAKTEDDTPIALYVILLLAGAGGVGAAWIYRQRRKTKE